MRLFPIAILLCATATTVRAEESFKAGDYEIVAGDRSIDVRKGKRRTLLIPGSSFGVGAKVDLKAKKVVITYSEECAADLTASFTFDQLEARLVNAEGVSLHLKKDWAGAAPKFAQVAKLDPAWNLGGYNLASALTRLGKLDEANAALAPWFSSAPLATYIQVAVDPDLQPLLATKAVAAVRGAKPGAIKIGERGLDSDHAYSADRGWLAVHHSGDGYLACNSHAAISIFEVKTGKQLGSINLDSLVNSGGPCGTAGRGVVDKAKQARLAKVAIAEQILVAFGFAKVPSERVSVTEDSDSGKRTARLPKAKLGVVHSYNSGKVNVLRGNTSIVTASMPVGGNWNALAHVPDAQAMVFTGYVPSDMCARTDEGVLHVPAAAPAKK